MICQPHLEQQAKLMYSDTSQIPAWLEGRRGRNQQKKNIGIFLGMMKIFYSMIGW